MLWRKLGLLLPVICRWRGREMTKRRRLITTITGMSRWRSTLRNNLIAFPLLFLAGSLKSVNVALFVFLFSFCFIGRMFMFFDLITIMGLFDRNLSVWRSLFSLLYLAEVFYMFLSLWSLCAGLSLPDSFFICITILILRKSYARCFN